MEATATSSQSTPRIAQVVVDVPSREIDTHFDYLVPTRLQGIETGSCVLVEFGSRPVVGYVVGTQPDSAYGSLKEVQALLGGPYFSESAIRTARWISSHYLCPLSEAVKLFVPPGGTPKAVRHESGEWTLRHPGVGPVDDRWVSLVPGSDFVPKRNATAQRAVLDALSAGPVRAVELAADLGSIGAALRTLEKAGAVAIEARRRMREATVAEKVATRHQNLTDGQIDAMNAVRAAMRDGGGVVLLEGVTGSGKTEVYLRAIEDVLANGGSACVLVPEISLTPQTVGRFRSRFGDEVAVLHSRLSAGERFDQWDRVRLGDARIVVGARSALFAPFRDLRLIVIDEEHESSYKQGSAPRYHARDVAERLARECGSVLVLGSASPSMESLHKADAGRWVRIELPQRVTGRPLPPVTVVDMAAEFSDGHRSMFSRPLTDALAGVRAAGDKAVLFLNRRGFASFLLCRECGFVPTCDACSTSLTYHEVGSKLACHHCGHTRAVPAKCPECGSPYLRQFGTGTQRVQTELETLFAGWPVVRMDADTTKGKGAHERLLVEFEAMDSGVLLGTQMIAKGLDYPDVTLVGVISADVTLNLPDFRAGERTYQLLEQVAGRAGRAEKPGTVVVQTYWPEHPAVRAAAAHDPSIFYDPERELRSELGYPPFGRLANVLVWGSDSGNVERQASEVAGRLVERCPEEWQVLGPSPAPLARLKGVWRWHVLVKAPDAADLSDRLSCAMKETRRIPGVTLTVDIDPLDLL